MTTIYIEEITSDEEQDHDYSHDDHDVHLKSKEKSDLNQNDRNKTPQLLHDNLKPCPIKIGGGASFSIIETKGYVFGGCSRSGKPSAQLHCYDFSKLLSQGCINNLSVGSKQLINLLKTYEFSDLCNWLNLFLSLLMTNF